MGKTVYSLVLSSEIIAEVDILAAREGMSRSGFVNRLLAQHTSLPTPEAHSRKLAQAAAEALRAAGLRAEVSPTGTLAARTALRYKYNPTLLYTFEPHTGGEVLGVLRVGLRSQNETLLGYLRVFFTLFAKLEATYLPAAPPAADPFDNRRFTRILRRNHTIESAESQGAVLASYIEHINICMKSFFENLHDANDALQSTEQVYLRGLSMREGIKEL